MKKETERARIGRLVRAEAGKSQIKMGDAMTFRDLIFDEILRDWSFCVWGVTQAQKRKDKRDRLAKK